MRFVAFLAYAKKSLAALIGGVIGWAAVSLPGHVSWAEWIGLAVIVATSLGVYNVGNGPWPVPKPAAAPVAPQAAK